MTSTISSPPIILIAGHWLGAWAWDALLSHLQESQPLTTAMTLPGLDPLDPGRPNTTLEDQIAAILEVITQYNGAPSVLVAHSGANAPVTMFIDQYPELVARVVWVDSGPVANGTVFAPDLPAEVPDLPLPAFDVLGQQASLAGLSPQSLEQFRNRAVPQPGSVLRQPITLTNVARYQVPTTLICCSMPSAQVLGLARSGHPMFAEVQLFTDVSVVDLPTGHWPMWSRPIDLANAVLTLVG